MNSHQWLRPLCLQGVLASCPPAYSCLPVSCVVQAMTSNMLTSNMLTSCPDQPDQQQQPQSPTQQLFAAHLALQQQQQQQQESTPSPSRQQSRLGSSLHTSCSAAGSHKAAADAGEAVADPKVSSLCVLHGCAYNTRCLQASPQPGCAMPWRDPCRRSVHPPLVCTTTTTSTNSSSSSLPAWRCSCQWCSRSWLAASSRRLS